MKQAVQLPIHWILYPPTDQKKNNTVRVLVLSVELKTENKIQLNQCIMKALEPLMIIIGHNIINIGPLVANFSQITFPIKLLFM